ncbi:Sof1-domain-containing protein [Gymnopus androsaceus JB14]|uniref:Sof1-domain-containing protein n=1 Tax=Gymnopus androsaceus JB14 TaxID=1447944 RepID=A0A6A4I5P8_9AGAR|nr:Sof1-domain-containing protein [Gymnopus androsaceus JB14]
MAKISVLQHDPSSHTATRPGDPTPVSRNLNPFNASFLSMFAKPFVDALEGHIDAVEVLAKQGDSISTVASGSWDGGPILARMPQAHKGKVTGLCGVDRNVKLWKIGSDEPINVFPGKSAFNSIDHQRSSSLFATASTLVQVWDETKSAPISNLTFPTSTETISSVRFNLSKAERRVVMQMRANALSWSPTFPTNILLASEDHNLYTFDIRHLASPSMIYKAIVTSTLFTTDARFVLSGSDDGNVRIWKGKASERLGIVTARERAAIEYRSSLVDRWKMDKEVGKVARTRHLPKPVYTANKLKNTMLEARRVKEERRRKHTRAGESKPKAERKKVVLVEQS